MEKVTIIGRSSSHFTRIARIFAEEFGINYSLEALRDLLSTDMSKYGGNPSLKLPALKIKDEIWFGSLPISRKIVNMSGLSKKVIWSENLDDVLLSNMQEMVLTAMSTEVNLVMNKVSGNTDENPYQCKMHKSLVGTMNWLEDNIDEVIKKLPAERDISFTEVSLFCLIEHLEFRGVLNVDSYHRLGIFRKNFGERKSAINTGYHFDT